MNYFKRIFKYNSYYSIKLLPPVNIEDFKIDKLKPLEEAFLHSTFMMINKSLENHKDYLIQNSKRISVQGREEPIGKRVLKSSFELISLKFSIISTLIREHEINVGIEKHFQLSILQAFSSWTSEFAEMNYSSISDALESRYYLYPNIINAFLSQQNKFRATFMFNVLLQYFPLCYIDNPAERNINKIKGRFIRTGDFTNDHLFIQYFIPVLTEFTRKNGEHIQDWKKTGML